MYVYANAGIVGGCKDTKAQEKGRVQKYPDARLLVVPRRLVATENKEHPLEEMKKYKQEGPCLNKPILGRSSHRMI